MTTSETEVPAAESVRLRPEVADVFRAYGPVYRAQHMLSEHERKVMRAIEQCRTAALGGHLEVCDTCGYSRPAYNSCRDRHCPKCQSLKLAEWVEARKQKLLPLPCFHVVFTLPHKLRRLCRRNDQLLYDLLFASAAKTLLELGHDPARLDAHLGITAVLHTWTRELDYHPHVHCIVTAGGLSQDKTRFVRGDERFLFPVRVMSALYRGLFLEGLRKLLKKGVLRTDGQDLSALLDELYQTDWVVYAKRPFGGPEQVFSYLGRYTHRTGISNQRILSMGPEGVCFATKGGRTVTLSAEEFIRRFLLHVLPPGYVKIRHYGLWASGYATEKLELARKLLAQATAAAVPEAMAPACEPDSEGCEVEDAVDDEEAEAEAEKAEPDETERLAERIYRLCGIDVRQCPRCESGRLQRQPLPQGKEARQESRVDTS